MRKLMLIGLLAAGVSAGALAQNTAAPPRGGKASEVADLERGDAKGAGNEAKIRADLEDARRRLAEAAREVADLSGQLGRNESRNFFFMDGHGLRRAALGVQLDSDSGKDGARVLKVSPGGAAEEAGLVDGDVIVALDDTKVAGSENPTRVVVDHMRDVKPDQKIKVKVKRDGKTKDFVVTARRMPGPMFDMHMPEVGSIVGGAMPQIRQFRTFRFNDFDGMELASITPKLGAYFGTTEGVLVVQAPDNAAFKLEDGDVIQAIEGRKPEDGAHALRILRSYKSGEKLTLSVLRQRKPLSLAVTMPERPDWEERILSPAEPPMAPVPAIPHSPGMQGGA
ncbi:MAG TPA: PDZ domain-containing protein [Steroidobacteraceae bacterium]|nr:PDZ domain-containing protein [Steroidobacteraceae bacterium]